jgi:hypothetical protein
MVDAEAVTSCRLTSVADAEMLMIHGARKQPALLGPWGRDRKVTLNFNFETCLTWIRMEAKTPADGNIQGSIFSVSTQNLFECSSIWNRRYRVRPYFKHCNDLLVTIYDKINVSFPKIWEFHPSVTDSRIQKYVCIRGKNWILWWIMQVFGTQMVSLLLLNGSLLLTE